MTPHLILKKLLLVSNMKFQLLICLLKKNVLEGEPAIMPIDFFEEKTPQIKEFLRNHRNTKIKMIMVRLMDKKRQDRSNKKTNFYSR